MFDVLTQEISKILLGEGAKVENLTVYGYHPHCYYHHHHHHLFHRCILIYHHLIIELTKILPFLCNCLGLLFQDYSILLSSLSLNHHY